jgi:CheY-like chemotaxis protein
MSQYSSGVRVLFVDDDPTQLELIELSLGRMNKGFRFESANSAERAQELISDQPFDCIVSNYYMPYMNGVDFCEKLRAEGCGTPFILFTCQDDNKVFERALNVGVDDYLEKGPSLTVNTVLAEKIISVVSKRRSEFV